MNAVQKGPRRGEGRPKSTGISTGIMMDVFLAPDQVRLDHNRLVAWLRQVTHEDLERSHDLLGRSLKSADEVETPMRLFRLSSARPTFSALSDLSPLAHPSLAHWLLIEHICSFNPTTPLITSLSTFASRILVQVRRFCCLLCQGLSYLSHYSQERVVLFIRFSISLSRCVLDILLNRAPAIV